jgi:Peroxiredoxin
MAEITLGGNPATTIGTLPAVGTQAPHFTLTGSDLKDRHLSDYQGKKLILNIFPSIDTEVCATSVRKFNEQASALEDVVVLNISRDLPFAHKRFCAAEGLENVETLSDYRHPDFGKLYGLSISNGAFADLFSRAVVVIDQTGKVTHNEQVPEIGQEPNYEAALAAL